MKRKTLELKEFNYKTPFLLSALKNSRAYSDTFIIETFNGEIDRVKISEEHSIIGVRAYNVNEIEYIEDRGLI